MGFFGDLINAVVGAVAAVADAIIDVLEPVVEDGGAIGEMAEDISEGAEAVLAATSDYADANGDGEIDDEDAEEILENAYKLLVGAFITKFGSDSSGSDDFTVSSWDDDSEDYIQNLIPEKTVTDGAAVTFDENGYSEPKSVWDCFVGLKDYVNDKVSDGVTNVKNGFNYVAECYQEGEENREKTEELIQESNNKLVNDAINFYKYSNEINEEAQRQSDEIEQEGRDKFINKIVENSKYWLSPIPSTNKIDDDSNEYISDFIPKTQVRDGAAVVYTGEINSDTSIHEIYQAGISVAAAKGERGECTIAFVYDKTSGDYDLLVTPGYGKGTTSLGGSIFAGKVDAASISDILGEGTNVGGSYFIGGDYSASTTSTGYTMSIGIGTKDIAPEAHATVTQTYSGKQTVKFIKNSYEDGFHEIERQGDNYFQGKVDEWIEKNTQNIK